jgi:putative transposase
MGVRGARFAAHEWRKRLRLHGMLCSMSRKGDCWDCENVGVVRRI